MGDVFESGLLGSGGMVQVYRAYDRSLSRRRDGAEGHAHFGSPQWAGGSRTHPSPDRSKASPTRRTAKP